MCVEPIKLTMTFALYELIDRRRQLKFEYSLDEEMDPSIVRTVVLHAPTLRPSPRNKSVGPPSMTGGPPRGAVPGANLAS